MGIQLFLFLGGFPFFSLLCCSPQCNSLCSSGTRSPLLFWNTLSSAVLVSVGHTQSPALAQLLPTTAALLPLIAQSLFNSLLMWTTGKWRHQSVAGICGRSPHRVCLSLSVSQSLAVRHYIKVAEEPDEQAPVLY